MKLLHDLPGLSKQTSTPVTGLSGNEIYCLHKLGLRPGNLCVGNSVHSLGMISGISSGLKTLAGGEIHEITELVLDGRKTSLARLFQEGQQHGGIGITGVTSEIITHGGNIEFLSIGSTLHQNDTAPFSEFSTAADAQELYCQLDAGFTPKHFAFGNVAYSIGIGGGIGGFLKGMVRGEVPQFTEIFDRTRHLALERITDEAKKYQANAVVGIETTITSLMGAQEMIMIGTASHHPLLESYATNPVTSDMTNQEMWNLVHIGFMPLRLVMGVSVYSLGLAGGIASAFRSMARGEVETLTSLLYEARHKALERVQNEAQRWGADEVVGVKTYIYELGGGMIEFLAIGTAVKKMEGAATKSDSIPPQAIIQDQDTFFESTQGSKDFGKGKKESANRIQGGPKGVILIIISVVYFIISLLLRSLH